MAFSFEGAVFEIADSVRCGPRFIIQQNAYGNGARMPWAVVDTQTNSPIKREPFFVSLKHACTRARELNLQWETVKAERMFLCQK